MSRCFPQRLNSLASPPTTFDSREIEIIGPHILDSERLRSRRADQHIAVVERSQRDVNVGRSYADTAEGRIDRALVGLVGRQTQQRGLGALDIGAKRTSIVCGRPGREHEDRIALRMANSFPLRRPGWE